MRQEDTHLKQGHFWKEKEFMWMQKIQVFQLFIGSSLQHITCVMSILEISLYSLLYYIYYIGLSPIWCHWFLFDNFDFNQDMKWLVKIIIFIRKALKGSSTKYKELKIWLDKDNNNNNNDNEILTFFSVISLLKDHIILQESYKHSYPIDWRTKKPVILRACKQWFIDTSKLQQQAMVSLWEKNSLLSLSQLHIYCKMF